MISLEKVLNNYPFQKRSALPQTEIASIESAFGIKFPQDYHYYLLHYEGYEGFIGKEYVRLWSVEELKDRNDGYAIQKWEPSFFGIGTTMGGCLIALESIIPDDFKVILTDFVSMSKEDSFAIGNNFSDFLIRLASGREWLDFLDER